MSSEQGAATKWVILVDGTQLASVEPGNSVEIGRKPLRPLPDDGKKRVEILDDSRSISKRHALLTVARDGQAFLRDLNSTNGTFLVRTGDELVRLQSGVDFPLQSDSVHVQFGDVPVDLAKFIEDDDSTKDDTPVVNLFDYAVDGSANEPEVADMSVDDILNLRAGEPTDIFNARNVRARATQLHEAEQQSFVPFTQPINPLPIQELDDEDAGEDTPRDLFADAKNVAEGIIEEPAATQQPFVKQLSDKPKHAGAPADRLISVTELASARPKTMPQAHSSMPRNAEEAAAASIIHTTGSIPVTSASAESAEAAESASSANSAETSAAAESAHDERAEAAVNETTVTEISVTEQPAEQQAQAEQPQADESAAQNADAEHADAQNTVDAESAQAPAETAAQAAQDMLESVDNEQNAQAAAQAEQSEESASVSVDEDYSRFQRGAEDAEQSASANDADTNAPDEARDYTAAFEPGSVFEKVANGEFNKQEPLVEVDGFTSDDARRSDDFAEQFQMARHPELLPFLAMNPSLYDDLFAWLAAQGNADIDEALSKNAGYEDYRNAMGK